MIESFYVNGIHSPFSNFYLDWFDCDGRQWPTMEHYYQAQKARTVEGMMTVMSAESPGAAKRSGRKVELRSDWEAVKLAVMRKGLAHKFTLGSPMGEFLLDSGDEMLIEGNDWGDKFWGMVDGAGENWLGHLLMARRAELRSISCGTS